MTVQKGQKELSCSAGDQRIDVMEVVDSPLNLAHQQCRKADRLLANGKYEEAVLCHEKAADLLTEAMKTSNFEQARLSMELQRDSHIKQQQIIQEHLKREARRQSTKARASVAQPSSAPAPSQTHFSVHGGVKEREFDTLLYQLQTQQTIGGQCLTPPLSGSRTTKDDKTRLEEQQTTIEDLRHLVDHLMDENQRLTADNKRLLAENARLQSEAADFVERSELWVLPQAAAVQEMRSTGKVGCEIAIPQLPPLEMPAQEDLCMYDLPPLELPDDIENELQELLDRDQV